MTDQDKRDPVERQVFPYFGGKGRVADEVWRRFGRVSGYLEPFGGSAAMLLKCPHPRLLKSETLNDLNGYIANFWRAVQYSPEQTARWADSPVSHVDLQARHAWLVEHRSELSIMLGSDPHWHDPKIAGWWVWGIACWIGAGWCDGKTHVKKQRPHLGDHGRGVHSAGKRPHLGDHGRGVHSAGKRPHLGDHGMGVHSAGQRPHLGDHGRGVHSAGQRPHLGDHGRGGFYDDFRKIAERLRFTRVTSCDWSSLKSTLHHSCEWAVFLDPPYTKESGRDASLYSPSGDQHLSVGHEVAAWALELSEARPEIKIALCGIAGEYEIPDSWERYFWKTNGFTYGGRNTGEVIWFSPSCRESLKQGSLI